MGIPIMVREMLLLGASIVPRPENKGSRCALNKAYLKAISQVIMYVIAQKLTMVTWTLVSFGSPCTQRNAIRVSR